jgi:hypothetical protein
MMFAMEISRSRPETVFHPLRLANFARSQG